MKQKTKKIVIISVLLIVLGWILIAGSLLFRNGPFGVYRMNGKWNYIGEEKEIIRIHENLQAFDSIDIDFDYGKVELIASDSYRFEFDGLLFNSTFTHSLEDGVLKIQKKNISRNLQLNFGEVAFLNTDSNILRVYYPADVDFDLVKVNCASSEVIMSGFAADDLQLACDFGSVTLDAIKAKNMNIKTSSGSMDFRNIEGETLALQADFGDQTLTNVSITKAFTINKSSGELTLDGLTAKQVKIVSDFGGIVGRDLVLSDVNIASSSGSIDLKGSIQGVLDVDIDFGEVLIALAEKRSDYNLSLAVDFGNVTVDGQDIDEKLVENNEAEHQMNLNSTSGNVKISFGK